MNDKEVWENALKNKSLKENFEVKLGGSKLPPKSLFKKEEEKETLRRLKQAEKRLDNLEKQYRDLFRDGIIIKHKLKNITHREINETTDSKK